MAFCSECGGELGDGAAFCSNCGTCLSKQMQERSLDDLTTYQVLDRSPSPKSHSEPDTVNRITNLVGFGLAWWFIVGPEILGIAAIIGFIASSWLWFGFTFLATWFLISFKWTAWIMALVFALFWAFLAGWLVYELSGAQPLPTELGAKFQDLSGAIVVSAVLFFIGLGVHWFAFLGHHAE